MLTLIGIIEANFTARGIDHGGKSLSCPILHRRKHFLRQRFTITEHTLHIHFNSGHSLCRKESIQLAGGLLDMGTHDETTYAIVFQHTPIEQRLVADTAHGFGQR